MEEASNLVQEPAHHDPYYGFCERHAMNPGHLVNLTNASTGASCVCVYGAACEVCGAEKAWRREREEAGKAPSLALITCVRARGRGKREEGSQEANHAVAP